MNLKGVAQVSPARVPGSTAAGATLSFGYLLPYLTLMTTCYYPQFASEEMGTEDSVLCPGLHVQPCVSSGGLTLGLCASHH